MLLQLRDCRIQECALDADGWVAQQADNVAPVSNHHGVALKLGQLRQQQRGQQGSEGTSMNE